MIMGGWPLHMAFAFLGINVALFASSFYQVCKAAAPHLRDRNFLCSWCGKKITSGETGLTCSLPCNGRLQVAIAIFESFLDDDDDFHSF